MVQCRRAGQGWAIPMAKLALEKICPGFPKAELQVSSWWNRCFSKNASHLFFKFEFTKCFYVHWFAATHIDSLKQYSKYTTNTCLMRDYLFIIYNIKKLRLRRRFPRLYRWLWNDNLKSGLLVGLLTPYPLGLKQKEPVTDSVQRLQKHYYQNSLIAWVKQAFVAWPEVLTATDNIVSMEKSILNRSLIHLQIMTTWVYTCLSIQIYNREMLFNIIIYIYWFFFFMSHTHFYS